MKIHYSSVSANGLNFLIAELKEKLAGCTVPGEEPPNLDKFIAGLRVIYPPDLEICKGEVNQRYRKAVLEAFNGRDHMLSKQDIAFTAMRNSYSKVLQTLFTIKKGTTLSYSDLATKSGLTKSHSRFVGSVMAKNPIPLIIPCHRVVKRSGELGNYSGTGGIKTKKRLLTLEAE